ncbi:MAG: extracellular solute-binding protein [Ruminococcaceae bacterium]|nr:extracellular solute-binding protein [Oscillospiraceae bacterium]
MQRKKGNKRMKQHLSLFLLCTVLIGALLSCGETDTPGTTPDETQGNTDASTAAVTEAVITDGLPDTDMQGFEMRFLNATGDSLTWANVQLDAEAANGDLINDSIFERNSYIEERFNCTLNYVSEPWHDISTGYQKIVMAGDNPYDIIMLYGIDVAGKIDQMADMTHIPHLSLDREWWNPHATRTFRIGDKQVAAAGNFSLSYVSTANCLLFNKTIHDEINLETSLYDTVRTGKWTTDEFFRVCRLAEKDLNGDGAMDENDRMGVTGTVKAFHHLLVIGAGLHYVTMDEENFPVFDAVSNEKLVGFIGQVLQLEENDPNAFFWPTTVDGMDYPVDFQAGGCMFYVTWPHNITALRDMKDDFGIIPAPKYDEAQDTYYANMANGEVATLPRSYDPDRLENIGTLLEAMSFYTQKEIVPTYKNVLLENKVARDEDSSEMLDIVFGGITFDYGINVWQEHIGNKIMSDIFLKKNNAVVSTLEKMQNAVTVQIEKLRETVADMP